MDLSASQRQLDGFVRLIILILSGNVALLAILSYALFTYTVIRPVRAIGVATERAADGDLASPIALTPRNELGQLARRFNAMLARLDAQRDALRGHVGELEHANEALHRATQSLVRSEKLASVGQLSAGLAHEIGNPLSAVYGYAELLTEADAHEIDQVRRMGQRIAHQVERMRAILEDLLRLSRDDSGRSCEPTDLARCVEETLRLAQASPRTKHLSIDEDLPPLPRARAVASHVVQVLLNIVFNAADALGEPGGRVTIAGSQNAEGEIVISVTDNGQGIPEALRDKLFEPFFTTKEPGQGTGLGLAISAHLMSQMGGDLKLAPSDRGARFELRFEPTHSTSTEQVPDDRA